MRVVHIITRLILGGAQENTVLTCEDLLRSYGDEIVLITGPPLGPEGSLLARARAGGVPVVVVPDLRLEIHPARDLRSYKGLIQELQAFQPDVVHTHGGKAGLLGRRAASALGVPAIVHTIHGAAFDAYQGRAGGWIMKRCESYAARRCHKLVSVADAMTESFVRAGIAPREKFVTIYSGMEVEPFLNAEELRGQVRRELGYHDGHVVVGKIARLFHLKGHEYLIRAARQVVDALPHVRFLLVGDGVLADRIRQQIVATGLREHFHFTGLVGPERIPGLIAATDMVVHTSLREGLARVLPQALIAGRPVVSYDIDGAREVVIPGETGFLLPAKSIEPLAGAICELATHPDLRSRLGTEGRQRFTDQFRHEHMTAQLRALYERLLSHSGEQILTRSVSEAE